LLAIAAGEDETNKEATQRETLKKAERTVKAGVQLARSNREGYMKLQSTGYVQRLKKKTAILNIHDAIISHNC